eukprot:UN27865
MFAEYELTNIILHDDVAGFQTHASPPSAWKIVKSLIQAFIYTWNIPVNLVNRIPRRRFAFSK